MRFISFFATRTRLGLWFRNATLCTMSFRLLAYLFIGSVRDDFALPRVWYLVIAACNRNRGFVGNAQDIQYFSLGIVDYVERVWYP